MPASRTDGANGQCRGLERSRVLSDATSSGVAEIAQDVLRMVLLLDGGGHQQVEVFGEALDDAQLLKTRATLEYQPVRLGRDVDSAAEGIRACGPPQRDALSDCARSTPSITASRSATPTATPTSRSPRPSRRNPTAQRNPPHHPRTARGPRPAGPESSTSTKRGTKASGAAGDRRTDRVIAGHHKRRNPPKRCPQAPPQGVS